MGKVPEKKRQAIYDSILASTCGCYKDEVGNRPCDNGCICDRCSADWIQEAYKQKLAEVSKQYV